MNWAGDPDPAFLYKPQRGRPRPSHLGDRKAADLNWQEEVRSLAGSVPKTPMSPGIPSHAFQVRESFHSNRLLRLQLKPTQALAHTTAGECISLRALRSEITHPERSSAGDSDAGRTRNFQ